MSASRNYQNGSTISTEPRASPLEPDNITIAEETFDQLDVDEGVRKLARAQWEELERHKELRPFSINWDAYRKMNAGGFIIAFGARHRGELIGFMDYMLLRGMRNANSCLMAYSDMWHIAKPYRDGILAARMLRRAEQGLRTRGVRIVLHSNPHHQPLGPFFARMGYRPVETTVEKVL